MRSTAMKFETRAVHAGHRIDPATGSVAPPIYLSTTFARDPEGVPIGGHTYIRESNPNQEQLEEALFPLEGGEAALVFASGMAAGIALLQALPPGSHVLFPDDVYYGFRVAAGGGPPQLGDPLGLRGHGRSRGAGGGDPSGDPAGLAGDAVQPAAQGGRPGGRRRARPRGRRAGRRSTTPSPPPCSSGRSSMGPTSSSTRPPSTSAATATSRGAPSSSPAATSSASGSAICATILGAVASPFNDWLVLRGVRTLACRMAAQSASALAVARALEALPAVSAVHYPGLPSHPGHEIARRQMSAFGAMLSFRVGGGREAALEAVGRARLFTRATSLGGVESLIEHRATSEGPGSRTPQELIRVSIGLEHPDDLIEDLAQALGGS